jgi:hypothetical protein
MIEHDRKRRSCLRGFLAGLFAVAGLVWLTSPAQAVIRVGNSEVQVVYEMQHSFQFDGSPGDNFEWVQWRNELRVEYEYQDLVTTEGGLFDKNIKIPGVRRADFSFMYRGRFDPVYMVRDKYDEMYPHRIKNQLKSFAFPENGFREMNLDVSFGDVMGHRLSMRLGKQQIVWGESDLFRSIDIANPLRLDQNQAVGEAFEDFRTPIWAIKFLYDIGNVGSFLSNVGIETFYTPRWRPINQHLVLEGGWGGLRYDDPNYVGDTSDYFDSPTSPGVLTTKGVPWGPYNDYARIRHPWSLFRVGRNLGTMAPDSGCNADVPCTDDAAGRNGNFLYRIGGGHHTHHIRGTKFSNSMVGVRMMGKIFGSFDFTLNYMFKRTDAAAVFDLPSFFGRDHDDGLGRLDQYGRRLGSFSNTLAGSDGGVFTHNPANPDNMLHFRRALDRCFRENKATFFSGVDSLGYSQDGNLNNDRNSTACFEVGHWMPWTNVFGFTLTYNDFDYTGAVFRLEQSWSTNEARNESVGAFAGADQNHYDARLKKARERAIKEGKTGSQIPDHPYTDGEGNPCAEGYGTFCPSPRTRIRRVKSGSSIWRSMIGFDLIQSFQSFPGMGWTRGLPGGIGDQATFYTFQALTTYQNNNRPSGINAFTNAPRDRHHRWNQLYTFGTSGFYFRGKLEPLFAFAYSVNAKQPLILAQTYWHGLFFRNLDLYAGTVMYMGSRNDVDGTLLNLWADRDLFWIRLQYYLL